jgi:hypothetical protein
MDYRPLSAAADEIRLITILPAEDGLPDDQIPLRCALEHVSLRSTICGKELPPDVSFKGESHVWPEACAQWDVSALFKDKKHPLAQTQLHATTTASSSTSIDIASDDDLPWRYDWGAYVALSYVWGPPTSTRSITLNDRPFEVTENLYYALEQLRKSQRIRQGFKVWVDAICINQGDLDERSLQVARMRDIYTSAWQVVVWLGPEADDSDLALTAMHWMANRMKITDPLEGFYHVSRIIDARPLFIMWATYRSPLKKAVYRALCHLFLRSYWHRLWILQEITMAREDAPVICGSRCLQWKEVHDAACFIAADEARFGHDVVGSVRPRILQSWSWEFARDRVVEERKYASERLWRLLIKMIELQRQQKEPREHKSTRDALEPLLLGREAEVTQEKDRVYGLLGFNSVATLVDIKPDYTLTLSSIYVSFSRELLSCGNLDLLRHVSRPIAGVDAGWTVGDIPPALNRPLITPVLGWVLHQAKAAGKPKSIIPYCSHDLPSWTVCWTCQSPPVVQLLGRCRAGGTAAPPSPIFCSSSTVLILKGILLDTITSLSSFHNSESDSRYPLNTTSPAPNSSAYGTLDATRIALWRTIVGNTTRDGDDQAPDYFSWLLHPEVWQEGVAGVYSNGFGLHEFMSRNKRLILCGYTLEELIHGRPVPRWKPKDRVYNPTEEQREALSWAMNAIAWRRLVGTENGRVGLAAAAAQKGDKIAVLMGCGMPILLRRERDGWTVVGECYLYGIMEGEVANAIDERRVEIVDIKVY